MFLEKSYLNQTVSVYSVTDPAIVQNNSAETLALYAQHRDSLVLNTEGAVQFKVKPLSPLELSELDNQLNPNYLVVAYVCKEQALRSEILERFGLSEDLLEVEQDSTKAKDLSLDQRTKVIDFYSTLARERVALRESVSEAEDNAIRNYERIHRILPISMCALGVVEVIFQGRSMSWEEFEGHVIPGNFCALAQEISDVISRLSRLGVLLGK